MEVLTTAEMGKADQLAIAGGTSGFALMLSAGRAVADAAADLVEEGPVVVVAGGGNNGGDGFVAASELVARGRQVTVVLLGSRDALTGDAALAARHWSGPVLPGEAASIGRPVLIIDALFGAGLNRIVKDGARDLIEAINASGAPVVSVDLPSGINGNTGSVLGVAVRATETVTFFRRKPGHLLMPGRSYCGQVRVADIGIDEAVLKSIAPQVFENVPELWDKLFPVPGLDGHKYAKGHAVVLSGNLASTGAARLAARGALRGGAGLVTVLSPSEALAVNAASLTAIMVRPVDTAAEFAEVLEDRRLNTCVIGPGAGVGLRTRALVLAALAAGRQTVLDADALTSFADKPVDLFEAIKAATESGAILTPHQGEFL
ncbi:MAG: NAD(P)H-hydrate epimerase, partial [Xanthobacteraceae bacterium]